MTAGCTALGSTLAALVDGELDHAARERAQAHLLHCDTCRAEAEAQRRLKASLRELPAPAPSAALLARLCASPDAAAVPQARAAARVPSHPPSRARAARGPSGRAARAARGSRPAPPRRTTVGSALAVLGVGVGVAVLTLGGSRPGPVVPDRSGAVVVVPAGTTRAPLTTVPVGASLLP